jgi:hypothetical protein
VAQLPITFTPADLLDAQTSPCDDLQTVSSPFTGTTCQKTRHLHDRRSLERITFYHSNCMRAEPISASQLHPPLGLGSDRAHALSHTAASHQRNEGACPRKPRGHDLDQWGCFRKSYASQPAGGTPQQRLLHSEFTSSSACSRRIPEYWLMHDTNRLPCVVAHSTFIV